MLHQSLLQGGADKAEATQREKGLAASILHERFKELNQAPMLDRPIDAGSRHGASLGFPERVTDKNGDFRITQNPKKCTLLIRQVDEKAFLGVVC